MGTELIDRCFTFGNASKPELLIQSESTIITKDIFRPTRERHTWSHSRHHLFDRCPLILSTKNVIDIERLLIEVLVIARRKNHRIEKEKRFEQSTRGERSCPDQSITTGGMANTDQTLFRQFELVNQLKDVITEPTEMIRWRVFLRKTVASQVQRNDTVATQSIIDDPIVTSAVKRSRVTEENRWLIALPFPIVKFQWAWLHFAVLLNNRTIGQSDEMTGWPGSHLASERTSESRNHPI